MGFIEAIFTKNHLSELYKIESDLCAVKTYLNYVQRTVDIRQDPRLFIKSQNTL